MKTIWILIVRLFSTYLKNKGISNTYLLFYFLFRLDSCSESHELRCVISCVYASSAILRAILLASNIPQGSHGTIGSKTFWIRIHGAPASLKCKYIKSCDQVNWVQFQMRLHKEVDYNVIREAFTLINHFGPRLSLFSYLHSHTTFDGNFLWWQKKIECTIFLFNRGGHWSENLFCAWAFYDQCIFMGVRSIGHSIGQFYWFLVPIEDW